MLNSETYVYASESLSTISFPNDRTCNLCFITYTPTPLPPDLSFPLFLSLSPCYVSPLCPNLWPLGFEERQRWPLKTATAKFVRGHSHECTSLSASLTSSFPPPHPSALLILRLPPPPTNSHGHTHRAPDTQMTPLIMYLRYLAPVKTALG